MASTPWAGSKDAMEHVARCSSSEDRGLPRCSVLSAAWVRASDPTVIAQLCPPEHRSHFGSRYKLGCCRHAGLFLLAQLERYLSPTPSRTRFLPRKRGRAAAYPQALEATRRRNSQPISACPGPRGWLLNRCGAGASISGHARAPARAPRQRSGRAAGFFDAVWPHVLGLVAPWRGWRATAMEDRGVGKWFLVCAK